MSEFQNELFIGDAAPATTELDPADPLAGLYGALCGTVRFMPEVDLTQPTETWSAYAD